MMYANLPPHDIIVQINHPEKEISYVSLCLNTALCINNVSSMICLQTRLERYINKFNLLKIKLA